MHTSPPASPTTPLRPGRVPPEDSPSSLRRAEDPTVAAVPGPYTHSLLMPPRPNPQLFTELQARQVVGINNPAKQTRIENAPPDPESIQERMEQAASHCCDEAANPSAQGDGFAYQCFSLAKQGVDTLPSWLMDNRQVNFQERCNFPSFTPIIRDQEGELLTLTLYNTLLATSGSKDKFLERLAHNVSTLSEGEVKERVFNHLEGVPTVITFLLLPQLIRPMRPVALFEAGVSQIRIIYLIEIDLTVTIFEGPTGLEDFFTRWSDDPDQHKEPTPILASVTDNCLHVFGDHQYDLKNEGRSNFFAKRARRLMNATRPLLYAYNYRPADALRLVGEKPCYRFIPTTNGTRLESCHSSDHSCFRLSQYKSFLASVARQAVHNTDVNHSLSLCENLEQAKVKERRSLGLVHGPGTGQIKVDVYDAASTLNETAEGDQWLQTFHEFVCGVKIAGKNVDDDLRKKYDYLVRSAFNVSDSPAVANAKFMCLMEIQWNEITRELHESSQQISRWYISFKKMLDEITRNQQPPVTGVVSNQESINIIKTCIKSVKNQTMNPTRIEPAIATLNNPLLIEPELRKNYLTQLVQYLKPRFEEEQQQILHTSDEMVTLFVQALGKGGLCNTKKRDDVLLGITIHPNLLSPGCKPVWGGCNFCSDPIHPYRAEVPEYAQDFLALYNQTQRDMLFDTLKHYEEALNKEPGEIQDWLREKQQEVAQEAWDQNKSWKNSALYWSDSVLRLYNYLYPEALVASGDLQRFNNFIPAVKKHILERLFGSDLESVLKTVYSPRGIKYFEQGQGVADAATVSSMALMPREQRSVEQVRTYSSKVSAIISPAGHIAFALPDSQALIELPSRAIQQSVLNKTSTRLFSSVLTEPPLSASKHLAQALAESDIPGGQQLPDFAMPEEEAPQDTRLNDQLDLDGDDQKPKISIEETTFQ